MEHSQTLKFCPPDGLRFCSFTDKPLLKVDYVFFAPQNPYLRGSLGRYFQPVSDATP